MPARVLVVEDDHWMREFLVDSITECGALALDCAVGTFAQAMVVLELRAPAIDVLLVDLGLPDGNGIDLIRRALALNSLCQPLVLSLFGDDENVLASIEAGALGYIHKDADPSDIAGTILEMRAGGSPISPMIARRVLARYSRFGSLPRDADPAANTPNGYKAALLSEREHQVLALISRGYSYREIANLMRLSVHTIQTHIKNIYIKLAVHSKNEAVFEATRMGLL